MVFLSVFHPMGLALKGMTTPRGFEPLFFGFPPQKYQEDCAFFLRFLVRRSNLPLSLNQLGIYYVNIFCYQLGVQEFCCGNNDSIMWFFYFADILAL
jgi:hypothetical protein